MSESIETVDHRDFLGFTKPVNFTCVAGGMGFTAASSNVAVAGNGEEVDAIL